MSTAEEIFAALDARGGAIEADGGEPAELEPALRLAVEALNAETVALRDGGWPRAALFEAKLEAILGLIQDL